MFGSIGKGACLGTLCALLLAVGCGGGNLDIYNNSASNNGDSNNGAPDMGDSEPDPTNNGANNGAELDAGGLPDEGAEPDDMGNGGMPDLPAIDMEMPDPAPTTNAEQTGPTVNQQITSQCSTGAVKGLSLQLIEQMNCLDPGVMKSFAGANGISYSATVFPFQQGPATDALVAAAQSKAGTMPINSALRTIAQQLLLYEWYVRGLCNANLAATPGRSNHNGGLAVDIGDNSVWRTPMRNRSYVDNVSGEPWHFYFSGAGGKDVRSLSVLAFQQLYNLNFPENPIDEDGAYGPMTEGALKSSPANGFTREPMCNASMLMAAYPHRAPLEVEWERIGEGFISVRTIAPTGVRLVEYRVAGKLVGYSDQTGPAQFETVIEIPRSAEDDATVEIRAYDAWGREKGRALGSIDGWTAGPAVFIRPTGGINYEIGVEDLPSGIDDVDYYIDGVPTEQDPDLRISPRKERRLAAQLEGEHTIDVVLYDKRGRIKSLLQRTFNAP